MLEKDLIQTITYRKEKKVIGLMKDKLEGKIMTEFALIRPETYSYLIDDDNSDKKPKGTKKCVIKRRFKFNDHKYCLLNNEIISKSQQRFISDKYNLYTEEINKISLSRNGDKRLQTFDRITSYLYERNAFKVCESKILSKYK